MNNQFQQLVNYIREQQASGHGDQEIRNTLVSHGWPAQMVDDGFGYVSYNTPVDQPTVPLQTNPVQSMPTQERQGPQNEYSQPQTPFTGAATSKQPKYKLFQAVGDVARILRYGFWRFLGTIVIGYVITILAYMVFTFGYAKLFTSGLALSVGGIWVLLFGALVGGLLYAFSWAMLVSSASHGLENSAKRGNVSLLILVKKTLGSVWRVTLATLLFSAVITVPILLMYVLLFTLLFSGSGFGEFNTTYTVISIVVPVLMLIWMLIALLRYTLVPYIALFEPQVSVLKTLKRSNFLLKHGGQWFLFKEGLILFVLTVIVILVSGQNLTEMQNSPQLLPIIYFAFITVMIVVINYMLYVNRKTVRG